MDDFLWSMVEDLHAFEVFPWGTYVYSKSQHYIRLAMKERKLTGEGGKKINLYSFVWAFQVQLVIYYSLLIVYNLFIVTKCLFCFLIFIFNFFLLSTVVVDRNIPMGSK